MLRDFALNQHPQEGFNVAKVPSSSAPISGEYPATSATRKGGQPKLDSVLVQGALLNDITGSGHEGWLLPESLNGGCRSSKETSAKRRFQPLMTSPSSLRRRVNDPWN